MRNELKHKLGEEAYDKLNELIRREANLLNVSADFEVRKQALKMLLTWIGSIYEIDRKPAAFVPDVDLDKLFKYKQ